MNKKVFHLVIACIISATVFAQAPQSFKYQSVVRDAGGVIIATQSVSFRLSIHQNSTTGTIVYSETQTLSTNTYGLANMDIGGGTLVSGNFSTIDWSLGPYFLEVEFDPTGGSSYTSMGTSQLLSVPYSLYSETSGSSIPGPQGIQGIIGLTGPQGPAGPNNTLDMAYDEGGAGVGRTITIDAGEVDINTATASGIALRTTNSNTGVAIIATSSNAANTFSGIQSTTNSSSVNASAIIGNTDGAAWGVSGQAGAISTAQAGVYGSNLRTNGGHGVLGIGFNGVVGETSQSTGFAIFGDNLDAIAPLGNGIGVAGRGYYGVLGEDRYLGGAPGAYGVYCNGNLGATGTKTFRIDHPKDPENKFLRHFSIESNEVLNVYRGTITFDNNGDAIVVLPDYFNDINRNISYQLTPIGAYMPLFVKEKVNNNQFVVSGGITGKEVSWVVYAERNDLYMQNNPDQRKVELEKRPQEKGNYLIPSLYNVGNEKAIFKNQPQKVEQKELNTIR